MTLRKPKPRAPRYRPQLTAEQITHALTMAKLDLCDLNSITHEQSLALISTLSPFKAKIDNEALTPSYIPTTVTASGGANSPDIGLPTLAELAGTTGSAGLTKEQQWEQAYNLYTTSPAECSALQIEMAKEYMYLNDLMTEAQEEAYEQETALAATATTSDMGGI